MLQRFCGPDGRARLVEALEIQPIVSGDTAIAEAVSGRVEVESFGPGSGIIEESAPGNDLYFILAGVVSVPIPSTEALPLAQGGGNHRRRPLKPLAALQISQRLGTHFPVPAALFGSAQEGVGGCFVVRGQIPPPGLKYRR